MSSPRGDVCDDTRVVSKEMTGTLHNSPPIQSARRKSGNDSPGQSKKAEHQVKVCFTRDFADVESPRENLCSTPESLSSASSFHSILSTKSSNDIHSESERDLASQDLSQDETFVSAIDETPFHTSNCSLNEDLPDADAAGNETPVEILENPKLCLFQVSVPILPSLTQYTEGASLSSISSISSSLEDTDSKSKENSAQDLSKSGQETSLNDTQKLCVSSQININRPVVQPEENKITEKDSLQLDTCVVPHDQEDNKQLNHTSIIEPKILEVKEYSQTNLAKEDLERTNNAILNETQIFSPEKEICNETRIIEKQCDPSETVIIVKEENIVDSAVSTDAIKKKQIIEKDLDRTLTLQEVDENFVLDDEQYQQFTPQRQSTTLSLITEQPDFEEFEFTAEKITDELLNPSQGLAEETDLITNVTDEIFQDPSTFDFLLARSNSRHMDCLRAESLYVKIDPLISINTSMLPQGNAPQINDPKSNAPLIVDIDITKELKIDELEKQKKEHEAELDRLKAAFQEKINKLQTQIAQEVKIKTQVKVMEVYKKSTSRLLTEKAKLQEELQAANHHLTNTEAAFNDVHHKYEKLKTVVSLYKNNETVLKKSIQENVDTIKSLETRYDQLKEHATAQLEKANLELDRIRKQNETETVKLHAMIRKAELKSNSLAEIVEQKTRENKEMANILNDVIARVGHGD